MSVIKPLTYYPMDFGKQLAATIVWAQFFAFYCLVFWAIGAPTESNVQWADPFIKIFPIQVSVWIVILSSLLLGVWCLRWLGVGSLLRHTPFIQIAIGVLTAVAVTVTIRVLVGDSLPDFIPAEESSKPGFLYGMVAGYGEEVLFRMLLMPLFFFGAFKLSKARGHKQRVFLSAIAAIVLTAVLFVLLHELGEPDGTIVWKLVATRFIVPGVVMGSLYLLFGPGFVIAMHSSMHVMIPLLFN